MSEKLSTQPYKGTRDFYPQEMRLRNWFFGVIRRVLEASAFEEYNGPMLESLSLYAPKAERRSQTSRPITSPTARVGSWLSGPR